MTKIQSGLLIHVVQALAKAENTTPNELSYSLYEYIDPEIFETLESHGKGDWTFTFGVSDHQVRIVSDGSLYIDGHRYHEDCFSAQTNFRK